MTLPRIAKNTVTFIDEYCEMYKNIFPEVRSFEYFKYLHLGIISDVKRKSLPEISKVVGLENAQGLHHFLENSPWDVNELKRLRIDLLSKGLAGESFIVTVQGG
ncbi:hypothetical protein [Cronbergia sp. UHCC 0137]|uniref:hypothetical protein n=1 Tax=Cronbergia sp. UHCC 0137 TaxID=3110239 RepID=UPI003A4C7743